MSKLSKPTISISSTLGNKSTITNSTVINAPSCTLTASGHYTIGSWPNTNQIISTSSYVDSSLQVKGDAEFSVDVKIKGKSIVDLIEKIEKRLAILHPNEKLEDEWEELKNLGIRYRELEQEISEKEKMWAILKK